MCADIHFICLWFIFNKALSAAPNTLDSGDPALLSVSEFSYAQCLWISSAVLRELTYACWRFHLPVCRINHHRTPLSPSLSPFPQPLETCTDFTGPHNHPEGSLKCSHSQGRYCLRCGPDPWCNAEALKKHHFSDCQEAFKFWVCSGLFFPPTWLTSHWLAQL